jgi:hypothetical protein
MAEADLAALIDAGFRLCAMAPRLLCGGSMVASSLDTASGRRQPSQAPFFKETAMTRFTKTITAIATAATLGLGIAATSATPAAAWGFGKGGGGWGGGFNHHWGPGLGVGIGLGVLGAAAAASYGGCYVTREAVRDVYGNFLYSRPVRVCD